MTLYPGLPHPETGFRSPGATRLSPLRGSKNLPILRSSPHFFDTLCSEPGERVSGPELSPHSRVFERQRRETLGFWSAYRGSLPSRRRFGCRPGDVPTKTNEGNRELGDSFTQLFTSTWAIPGPGTYATPSQRPSSGVRGVLGLPTQHTNRAKFCFFCLTCLQLHTGDSV